MDEMVTEFSDLLQVDTVGYSYENRPIRVMSYKNLPDETPAILFDGLHHARELGTVKMKVNRAHPYDQMIHPE